MYSDPRRESALTEVNTSGFQVTLYWIITREKNFHLSLFIELSANCFSPDMLHTKSDVARWLSFSVTPQTFHTFFEVIKIQCFFCLSLFISKPCNSDFCHCSSYLLKSRKSLPGSDSTIYLFKCLLAGDNLLRVVLSVCPSRSCRCDISGDALKECLQMRPQISSRTEGWTDYIFRGQRLRLLQPHVPLVISQETPRGNGRRKWFTAAPHINCTKLYTNVI